MCILEPVGNRPINESNRNLSIDKFDNIKEQFVRFLTTMLVTDCGSSGGWQPQW